MKINDIANNSNGQTLPPNKDHLEWPYTEETKYGDPYTTINMENTSILSVLFYAAFSGAFIQYSQTYAWPLLVTQFVNRENSQREKHLSVWD